MSGSIMTSRPECFSVYGNQVQIGYIQFQVRVSLAARDQGVARQVYELVHSGAMPLIKRRGGCRKKAVVEAC